VTVLGSTVKVAAEVPAPGAAIDVGLKLTVTPVGAPLEDSVTAELNPLTIVVVIVEVPFAPCATLTELGEAEMAKSGGATTVRLTVVLCVSPPPVPVIVIG